MVNQELIGELCAPRELIVPHASKTQSEQPMMSGALFLSGAKLYLSLGLNTSELITSS